jgi:diaminopimelate epimerase
MVRFVKAQACGNDFLVIDRGAAGSDGLEKMSADEERSLAVALCARTTGVGADGLEYLSWTGERSGEIKLYNADGSVAEISGNGTRCVAAWMAHAKAVQPGEAMTLKTDAGMRDCRVMGRTGEGRYEIASRMGVPRVEASAVVLHEEGIEIEGAVVSTGNPHFVIFVEDEHFRAYGRDWRELGSAICFHPDFPEQTNVEFVHVRDAGEISIRIFERGVGPTTSSGTGTCATSAAAIALRGCSTQLRVEAPGGMQQTDWPSPGAEILLTGPAALIASGEAFVGLSRSEG